VTFVNNRETLKEKLDGIVMPEKLYDQTLTAMKAAKRRRISPEVTGRFAAVAAALIFLAVGGTLLLNYMLGGEYPPLPLTTPYVNTSPSAQTLVTDYRPEITFIPKIEYHIIYGGYDEKLYKQAMEGENISIINSFEELFAFDEQIGGIRGVEDLDVDFNKQIVIIIFGFTGSSPGYLPPIIMMDDDKLFVHSRIDSYDFLDDIALRGYLLVFDQPFDPGMNIIYSNGAYNFEASLDVGTMTEINIDNAEGFRVIFNSIMAWSRHGADNFIVPDHGAGIAIPGWYHTINHTEGFLLFNDNKTFNGDPDPRLAAAVSPDHMTGFTVSTAGTEYTTGIVYEPHNGYFNIMLYKDGLSKLTAVASMDENGAWRVEWEPEPSPPAQPNI
jgi:hypothetical protein